MNIKSTTFKIISLAVAFTFLWQQILFAAGYTYGIPTENENNNSGFMSPGELAESQSRQEELIRIMNDNLAWRISNGYATSEELELKKKTSAGPTSQTQGQGQNKLTLAAGSGDVLDYINSSLARVVLKDGRILEEVVLSDTGDILSGVIRNTDASIVIVGDGKIKSYIYPHGAAIHYDEQGRVSSEVSRDGLVSSYSYDYDETGDLIRTRVTSPDYIVEYDKDLKLSKVTKSDSTVIEYSQGIIKRRTSPDGGVFTFDIRYNPDNTITSKLTQYMAASGAIYRYTLNETNALTSITVEKDGVAAAYNKDGALVSVTKDGQSISPETIAQAQADYDTALAIYQQKQQEIESYQTILNDASADLANKTAAKDAAQAALNAAIQNLNNAQSAKDAKQALYNTAYNDFVAAQSTYDAANAALNTAKSAETQASQNLANAQNTLAAKQTVLNNKIAARQAIQTTITNLNNEIQSDQTAIAQAQQSLNTALAEEQTAQTDYNNAQADVASKQAAYNNAIQLRQSKEAAFSTANLNLINARQAKIAAENALSSGNPYIVSSYTFSNGLTALNQYKNFINDQFNSYNSNLWYKPADSLATIGSGAATLKGTGNNYSALIYTKQHYLRSDKPVLTTTFKVSSTSGRFIAALDGYTSSNAYRRIGIYVYGGSIYLQTVTGSSVSNKATLISTAKANTNYTVELEVTLKAINVYLWESSAAKPATPSYTYTVTDWAAVRPYFSLYSGTGTIDYVTMKSPNYNSTYNSSSQLIKDAYQDGSASTYSYSTGGITISDYKKYLDSPYDLSSAGLWYKPADSLVAINNGIAALKGTGANYNAAFYSNQTFARANDVIVRSNFQASSTSGRFIAAVDGYTSSNTYRRVGVTMQNGRIYVQTVSGSTTSVPATLIAAAKANTNYTVEILASAQNIKIYLWESSSSRPASPSYTYTITDWAAIRPYFSVYSGTATVSSMSINYSPQVRTVLSGSSEYSQVLARNQLVKNLSNAIVNVNTTQAAYDAAILALNNARIAEAQAQQDLANAQNTLADKQIILNNKIAARQAIQAAIASLNNELEIDQAGLTQAQQNLNQALIEESVAQSDYNNAQIDVNTKQAAYNSAIKDRQAKETALSAAGANLTAKTTVKQQTYADLQNALQNLKTAQDSKDAALAAYDSVYAYYLSAEAARNHALTIFNTAKGEKDAAKTRADSLSDELNTLVSISSMFPSLDSLLAGANNKLNIVSAVYDSERLIQQVYGMDGAVQNYTKGLTDSVLAGSGSTLYSYDLSVMGNIEGTTIDRDGVKRIYDKYGNLTKISGDGISASVRDNLISRIEKDDGTIIEDAVFDSNNNIKSAKITRPDGVKATYSGGVLTEARQPDGSAFYYDASGNITKFINSKGIAHIYSTVEESGGVFTVTNAENPNSIQDPEEVVYQKYDSNKRLVQVKTKNGTRLDYSYSMDGAGNIVSAFVSDGKTITTYDENNNIKKTEILPTAGDPVSAISEYEYSRIRRVYKGDDLLYRYTYEFDDTGKEITVIENVMTGDFKRYKDELLTSVTDAEGLVTSYEYDTAERIAKSVVTYLGKAVNQYTYTYEGDNTIIDDLDGIKRTYNEDDKLTILEEGGRTYAYTYNVGSDGKEETVQELVKVKDESGSIASYDKGVLKSVVQPDGAFLSDFIFTNNKLNAYSLLKDGAKYFIEDGYTAKEIKSDGAIIEYYPDGWLKSVTSSAGERVDYSYEQSVDGKINYYFLEKNNIKSTYDKDGRLAQVVYEGSKAIKYLYDESQPAVLKGYELIDRQSHYFYDTSNRLIKAVDSNGREYDYEYTEDQGSVTSPYTSKYSSIEDIVNFDKENLEFIDGAAEKYLELASYPDPNVPLLLHLEGANSATQTTDSSYVGNTVSFNGNARLDTVNKKMGSSSLALDGSGDNLSIPDSDDWYYGTGSVTIDFWIKWAVVGSSGIITQNEGQGRRSNFYYYAPGHYFGWLGYTSIYTSWSWASPSFTPTANTWYHIAAVRNGNTLMIFVNGSLLGAYDAAGKEFPQLSAPLEIGGNSENSYLNGWIDEVRITKGKALWTSNFTPPEEGYRDLYKNNGVLTSNPIELNASEFKTISWNEFTPQGTDITIQTRTGDTPNPDDLTWSGWSGELGNPASSPIISPAAKFIQYKVNFKTTNSQVSPKLLTDSNGSLVRIDYVEMFENIFNAVTNGIDNNVELVKSDGADILRLASYPDPNVPLLLHLEGANSATQTTDSSYADHSVSFNGNARLDTVNKKMGSSSLALDGSGDNLSIPDSDDWYYGTGSVTIDFWIKWAVVGSSGIITQNEGQGRRSNFYYYAPGHYFGWLGYTSIYTSWSWASPSFTPTANTWYHIAAVRNGNTLMIFVNGSLLGAYDAAGKEFPQLSAPLEIGGNSENSYLNGWIDEVRITKGKALWTSNFTPPEAEYRGLHKTPGTIISNPIPIVATEIGGIIANVNTPPGTNVIFKTRTGSSPDLNDGTWAGWVEATKDSSGWSVHSPVNKYLQYQLILDTLDITKTPNLYSDGDSLLKLSYSYNKSFDATAPPDDLISKDYLKLTVPVSPALPQSAHLKPDFSWLNKYLENIESRVLSDDTVVQTEFFRDELTQDITIQRTKDDKITYFINGKMTAIYQRYDDGRLEQLMEYSYDSEGSLISVNMPSARNSLDTEITNARQRIAEERANYLRNLAQQKGLAYTQIRDQVQSVREEISAQRSRLQSQLYQEVTRQRWVGWWIFGWYETYTETVEVPGVRDAINQLNEQERQLNDQESAAYAQLDNEVSAAMQKLNQDEGTALTEIRNQEKSFQGRIIEEETTPIILEHYRSILGRDPDEAETKAWLATVNYNSTIDVSALKQALFTSDERHQQEAFVAAVKNRIKDTLYNYMDADAGGKESILVALGLTAKDAVKLDKKSADAILSFLDKQNIHFGRSAFVALGTILSNSGITYNLEDLALKTILVDIFTGSLNKFSEGTLLELSMYSLSKAAESYGLTLDNTKLNFDDLSSLASSSLRGAPEGGDEAISIPLNLIAHLKNNHYVVITNISADDKVTYVEHNRGQNGYTWTVSRQDFENSWTGYAMVPSLRGAPEGGDEAISTIQNKELGSKLISTDLAQRVKGSCLPFLFPLLAAIFGAITGVATAVVGAIGAIVAGISAVIGPIIASIGTLITGVANFMVGIGTAVFNAISFVGTSLLSVLGPVGSWIGGIGTAIGNAFGLGGIISATGFNLTGLGLALGKTVVLTALSIGVSKGLEALGVNSTISGLLTSFVTGGVGGLFSSGFSALSFITGGLQGIAIQGVNALGQKLGIDPMLGNVISLGAGSIIGAIGNNISPTTGQFNLEGFSASIGKQILPNVSSELAYYGVTKAGELLGVDPRISYLAGIGIRSSLQAGLSSNMDPGKIWSSVTTGLLQGVANIGINYATQELGLNPLLANIGFSIISGAIKAGLQVATGESQDIFETLFETYKQNALTFLGYSDPNTPISAWQQAAYMSQILDFSNIVMERGLVEALNTYGAGFLNAVAVNNIVQSGYTLGGYFANKLDSGQYTIRTLQDGTQVKEVDVTDEEADIIASLFFQDKENNGTNYTDVVGKEESRGDGTYLSWGELGTDTYGKLGYTEADLYTIFDSDIQYQRIQAGQQAYVEIKDLQGNTLLVIEPTVSGHYNTYNSYGEYVEAKITNLISDRSYTFNGLKLNYFSELDSNGSASLLDFDLNDPNFVNLALNSLSLSSSEVTAFNNLAVEEKQQILHVLLLNGIGNPNPSGISPAYMKGFGEQLAIADPLAIQTTYIASYENSPGWTGKLRNCSMWVKDVYFSSDEVTDDILSEINYKFNGNPPADMVGLAYSGDGDPLLQALNKDLTLDMKSVVLVGAPIKYGRQILNANVENLVSIEGGVDAVVAFAGGYFGTFETNPNPLNLYRIALLGVDHLDYSYEPNPGNKNIDPLKVKAARLVAEVTRYANSTTELENFLTRTNGISYDTARKIYFVDLSKVTYDK